MVCFFLSAEDSCCAPNIGQAFHQCINAIRRISESSLVDEQKIISFGIT